MNFFLSSRWSVRLALIIIALLALIALTSQWWLPYDPQAIDLPSRLLSPDAQHWLGTDHLGRDIFSRLMAATRVSLGSVMACLLLVLTLGLVIGGSAGLIGGTMIIENIFAWPGVGRYAVSAIFNRDYPVIQCFTLMMVVVFVVCNLIVDLLNAALDPRIRRHEGAHA